MFFSNLVVIKTLSSNHRMYSLYTKFVKILEICKRFSENLVNESGNVPRSGPVPKFSDLEMVALSLTAETESIDSEKWLFDYKLQEENVARWDVPAISRKLPTSASVLRRTHIVLVISYTLSVG